MVTWIHRTGMTVGVFMGLLLAAAPSVGWGPSGHKLICEIAYWELTDDARDAVAKLIKKDKKYGSFSDSCNWPDNPRKRAADHYVNVPRHYTYIGTSDCRTANRCTFTGIREEVGVLTRESSSAKAKLASLKFLGHWVGDIHQPLHVSFKDDKGGNDILESPEKPCNGHLHRVWDSCILEERVLKGKSVKKRAEELRAAIDEDDRREWIDSTAVDWANESFKIARRDDVGYCFQSNPGSFCAYDIGNGRLDKGEPKRSFTVDKAYLDLHGDRVEARVVKAVVRLGAMLNEIFDPELPPE